MGWGERLDKGSELELALQGQLRARNLERGRPSLPPFVREHRFHATRGWRFDFSWPVQKLAVEVEGGTWTAGRHTRGAGFEEDCLKGAEAAIAGWRVMHLTGDMVEDGRALARIERALLGDGS
jgi:hypothetical protein